jgi:hypothetical protein
MFGFYEVPVEIAQTDLVLTKILLASYGKIDKTG